MRIIFTAALLAATAATPALAQDRAPFTGPHVEAVAGWDHLGGDNGTDSFLYGGAAGYDFQAGPVIVGIEGEVADSTGKSRGSDIFATGDNFRLNTDRDLYIGGRVGFAVAPATMIYAKAGYTNAKLEYRYDDTIGGTSFRGSNTLDGYRLGAGVEQKFGLFGPNGFAKLEYRYSNYQNLDVGSIDVDTDIDRHQVVAGLGVRF